MAKLIAVHSADVEWADAQAVFGLPGGQAIKVLNRDPAMDRIDCLIQFPPGYTEPRHTHAGHHITYVLEGIQEVDGTTLGPGDYLYGPANEPHGPFRYPEGALLFGVMWGGTKHLY